MRLRTRPLGLVRAAASPPPAARLGCLNTRTRPLWTTTARPPIRDGRSPRPCIGGKQASALCVPRELAAGGGLAERRVGEHAGQLDVTEGAVSMSRAPRPGCRPGACRSTDIGVDHRRLICHFAMTNVCRCRPDAARGGSSTRGGEP
jgi:hypothetical protein